MQSMENREIENRQFVRPEEFSIFKFTYNLFRIIQEDTIIIVICYVCNIYRIILQSTEQWK